MRILRERLSNVAPKAAIITATTASAVESAPHNRKPTSGVPLPSDGTSMARPLPNVDESVSEDDEEYLFNFQRVPNTQPLNGFVPEMSSFLGGGDRLVTIASGERFLCYVNARECADECTMFDFRAPISALLVASNFRFLVVCVDHHRQGATIVVKDSSTFDTIISFPARVLAQQMCIAQNNRTLLLFNAHAEGMSASICTYATMEGTLIAEAKIVSSVPTRSWEISFCPADEDVICLLADDYVNLMRATSNLISVFSTHRIIDVTCHTWADDVTQAFGTRDGRIILYRETVPLETIELKELHSKLISEVRDSPTAAVVKMYSCEFGMLVCVEAGVIFFFPPSGRFAHGGASRDGQIVGAQGIFNLDAGVSRWKNSKAIVINSMTRTSSCLRLHLDEFGGNILYADIGGLYTCNVSYSETVCKEGMRPIALRHFAPVKHVAVDVNSSYVASVDTMNLVLVTSSNTGKVLAGAVIADLISVVVLPGGFKLLVATHGELAVYSLLYQKLQKTAKIDGCGSGFQAMSADAWNKRIATVRTSRLLVFRADSLDKAFESSCGTKQDILRLKWSLDSVFIGILTTRDTVCLIEADSGNVLWIVEFKLRFFVDLSVVNSTRVYVMGNKFMMNRLDGGRETDALTVYHEAISFKEQSTVLLNTNRLSFVGTSTGAMICAEDTENFERSVLVNCRQRSSITTIAHNASTDQLYVGFEDGQVVCFNIIDAANDAETNMDALTADEALGASTNGVAQFVQDFVLCPVEEIVRYKTIISELNAERNMIREQGQQILSEYRKRKEAEIHQLNEQLEQLTMEMRDRMKKADEKFKAIEVAKKEVVAKMRDVMKDEVHAQKLQYEKMLNDQIKMTLEKEEKKREESAEVVRNYEARIADMQKASDELDAKWHRQVQSLQERVTDLSNRLKRKELQLEKVFAEKRSIDTSHENALRAVHKKHEQECSEHTDALKQLKAHVLRLKEENQQLRNNLEEIHEKFYVTNDELEDCRVQLETKVHIVGEETSKNHELESRLEMKKNELGIMTQKFKILQAEVEQEKSIRQTAQRRLREFDTLVSEMSDHVYDARRLEQSVLGLLAFFNATKVPVLNRAAVTVALRQNQTPVVPLPSTTAARGQSHASKMFSNNMRKKL